MGKKPFLLLIILCIFLLVGTTYWRAKTWQNDFKELFSFSKTGLKFPESPGLDSLFNQEEVSQEEFISPDGKLKINYSSDWKEAQKNELENLTQSILQEKVEFMFLARKVNMESAFVAFLMIQEIEREDKDLSEIIEEIKKEGEEEMEIIDSKINEKEAYLEIERGKEPSLRLKEKLLLSDQKVYLIAILGFERNWGEIREEAEEILASARLIE